MKRVDYDSAVIYFRRSLLTENSSNDKIRYTGPQPHKNMHHVRVFKTNKNSEKKKNDLKSL